MATVIRMPEVLTGASEAAVQTWLVAAGQEVEVGTPLAEIETEKAVVEYAAETAGTVLKLIAAEGRGLNVGDPIAVVGAAGESVDDVDEPASTTGGESDAVAEPQAAPEPETATPMASSPVAAAPTGESTAEAGGDAGADGADADRRFSSPIVRRLARERGIDLGAVTGTGPNGRIVRRDLDAAPARPAATGSAAPGEARGADAPVRSTAESGFEDIPLTPMRRAIARRLTESKTTVPHFYLVADCRVDELLQLRARVNAASPVKISVNDFVLKATALAFRDVPEANATWAETAIRRHSVVDVAVAVAIEGGLVTPVVRGVDRLPLSEIAATVADLASRAREGRLRQHELEGGSVSVSNLGMYGTTEFTAIINPPQAAILAVGAARPQPVVVDGELSVASVMTVTMSADHRVLDGALAAQWLAAFQRYVENPLSMLV